MEALAFVERQMDATTWSDYVSTAGVAVFTAFILFSMLMVLFMAKVQYRTDIVLKGSLWIWIWLAGALLMVWADFISNKYLDVLDPIRNFHCTIWDFWVLVLGLACYYAFQGYIMLESVIRSMASIEGTARPYQSVTMAAATTQEQDESWSCVGPEDPEEAKAIERKLGEVMDGYEDVPIDGESMRSGQESKDEEEEVEMMTAIEAEEAEVCPKTARKIHAQIDRANMKGVGLRASLQELWRRGWRNISEARRYSLLEAAYMAYVFASAIITCILAEIPGVTWYHKHADACLTVWYFKAVVILDMVSFIVILWLLYRRLRSNKNLPTLSANTFHHLLLATTAILGLMVLVNLTGLLTYAWGRCLYLLVEMALFTYSILRVIGTSMLETILNRHRLDDAIEYHLSCRTLPTTFGQVMGDADHIANILPEFLSYVNRDRRIFLVSNEHRLGGPTPLFRGEEDDPDIVVYEPGVGVDFETHSIIFPRNLTTTLSMFRQRKLELASLIADEDCAAIDPYNRSIVDDHIMGKPASYLAKLLESPNADIEFLARDAPAVPYTDGWMLGMGDKLRDPQVSTGPKLFDEPEFYIQTFLDQVYWKDFFNEPGTMRELRSAINMRKQLERNAVRRVQKTGRGEAVSDRSYAINVYEVSDQERGAGIVNFGDDDGDGDKFTIEDEEDQV